MSGNVKFWSPFITLVWLAIPPVDSAFAISVDVAKKCDALTAQAFPPREPGNPAAGSAKGTGRDVQDYFGKCVANNGRPPAAQPANGPAPQPASGQVPPPASGAAPKPAQ